MYEWQLPLGRGVRRLPPLFRDVVWLSLLRADGWGSPSSSRAPIPTDRQNQRRRREKAEEGRMRCKMKKKHILQISNNQVSHFHNSTFFNKLSRLSHQTTLSRPSWLCFICVSIPLCHSQQLRECPVVSRERQHSCGLWEHWGEVGLYPSHCVQSAPQRQESLLH